MKKRYTTVGLLAVLSLSALGQQAPSTTSTIDAYNPYRLRVSTQAVVLDVVVTNSKGDVVTNLTRDDFQIYEDKVPQTIHTFDPPSTHTGAANPPVHSTAELDRLEPNAPVTLIVLDEINTRFEDEAFARYSLKQFLNKQGGTLDHPTLLGAVDMHHFTLLHDYTTSKQELLNALEKHLVAYPWHLEGTSWKAEQFNASFAALIEVAEATAGHPGHKSLIWVGRGFPPFDPTTLSQDDNDGLKQIIESCTNAMRDARVVLYTLDPAGVSTEPPDVDPDGFVIDPFDGELDFSKMATATGGHAFYGRNDVDKLIETSSREGASFYTLSYTPTVPRTDTRAFHGIRVVMKNSDLKAETREGYYPHPPADTPKLGSKHADRQMFDLGLAAQSVLVYDGVHMTIKRLPSDPDKFDIILNSADLTWQQVNPQKLISKITVVAETFDKKGNALDHEIKLSTLQVGEGVDDHTAAEPTVHLYASVSTKTPAARVRFLIRVEATKKLGAVNFALDGKNPAGEVNN